MHAVADWALAAFGVLVLLGFIGKAREAGRRPGGGASRREGFLAHRRRLRQIREKGLQERLRDQARHEHRMREKAAGGASGAARTARDAAARIIRLRPEKPDGDDAPPRPGDGTGGGAAPRGPRQSRPPGDDSSRPGRDGGQEPPSDPPARPDARDEDRADATKTRKGNPPVSSPAIITGIADLVTVIDRIRAIATAGNVHVKRSALSACSVACMRFASMATSLSRAMSESGHYGPEITEVISTAAIHLTAAASAFAEAESSLKALLDMKLGDVPASGRQAPHHDELTETGAR